MWWVLGRRSGEQRVRGGSDEMMGWEDGLRMKVSVRAIALDGLGMMRMGVLSFVCTI